jgi:hypothetical protein
MEFQMINLQSAVKTSNHILQYPIQNTELSRPEYKLELVSAISPIRSQVEDFIQLSYHNHFAANLRSFFPLILAVSKVSDNSLIGALGVRYADETQLFSECYLSNPIENMIVAHEKGEVKCINRRRIIELGNFVVRKTSDIKTVIPFIGKFIKSLDVEWAVYTLTRPIKAHFEKLGIELNFLNHAEASSVNDAANNWGSYYKYKPAVYYSNVKNNMNQD